MARLDTALVNGADVPQESRREFSFLQPFRVVSDTDIFCSDDATISAYTGLKFRGDRLVSSHDPRSFEDFVRFHPRRAQPAPRRATASGVKLPVTAKDRILVECPWLTPEDLQASSRGPRRPPLGPRARQAGRREEESSDPEPDDDSEVSVASHSSGKAPPVDAAEVHRELAELREFLAAPEDDAESYFKVDVRGGAWTLQHRDCMADCVQAKARGSETRYWAQAFGFPKSKSFSFRLYGREDALCLAREFCRRGNYFAALNFESLDDNFEYSQEHVTACSDDLTFVTWLCSQDVDAPPFSKGMEIRAVTLVIA